jgi:hypothetical protein
MGHIKNCSPTSDITIFTWGNKQNHKKLKTTLSVFRTRRQPDNLRKKDKCGRWNQITQLLSVNSDMSALLVSAVSVTAE